MTKMETYRMQVPNNKKITFQPGALLVQNQSHTHKTITFNSVEQTLLTNLNGHISDKVYARK